MKKNTLIWDTEHDQNEKLRCLTYPSTAGERSGRLLPLDRYLLCVCKRGGRPGPQYSPPPRGPPRDPPSPPGTEPPNSPVPRLPDPLPPPGTRSDSGLSRSRLNGLSTNNSCHSYSERDGYKWVVESTSLKLIEKILINNSYTICISDRKNVVEGRGQHTSANCEAVSSRLFELLSRRLRMKQSHSCQTWLHTAVSWILATYTAVQLTVTARESSI